MILTVRVTPSASRNELASFAGGVLRIRLTAAPEGGKANRALIDFLAEIFSLPKSTMSIVGGATSKRKRVEVPLGLGEIVRRVSEFLSS